MTIRTPRPSLRLLAAASALSVGGAASAQAGEIVVDVFGIRGDRGEVACALYDGAGGFPLAARKAVQQWHDAGSGAVECRFADLPAGDYAVRVSHDLNGNREVDTNLLGMPTEPWGVSNNARPFLRLPTFTEAMLELDDDTVLRIKVGVTQ